jgi:hypothetical protein
MGVAEETRTGVAVSGLHQVGIWVAVVAGSPYLLFAKETVAASDCERNHDSITPPEIADFLPDFLDDSHELVPQYVARLHRRNESVIKVQIRTTNRRFGDSDDCVMGI